MNVQKTKKRIVTPLLLNIYHIFKNFSISKNVPFFVYITILAKLAKFNLILLHFFTNFQLDTCNIRIVIKSSLHNLYLHPNHKKRLKY